MGEYTCYVLDGIREKGQIMNKPLGDYTDRCGGCINFAFTEHKKIYLWGRCLLPNRSNYHQASQKACKLYVAYKEEGMEENKQCNDVDWAVSLCKKHEMCMDINESGVTLRKFRRGMIFSCSFAPIFFKTSSQTFEEIVEDFVAKANDHFDKQEDKAHDE